MVNAPRRKGTRAETAFVAWMHAQGETQVERHALHGSRDLGDITGIPSHVVSVKFVGSGKPMTLSGWVNDLEVMKANVNRRTPELELPSGIIVVRRPGYPDVGDWYAVQRVADWWDLFKEVLT